MDVQADIWSKFGVPINVAEGILEERIREVRRNLLPVNYNQAVDACKILDIPIMCVHTPCDNLVTDYLQKIFDREKPETVKDVIKILKEQFEYKESLKYNAGPVLLEGKEERRCGKVMVDMTGGTGGPKEMMEKLAQAGVGTLVGMHIRDEVRKEAKKYHINVVIAGHMASDSLGINLFLNELEKKGIEIVPCAGLIRKRS
jgi:putative NIF3 family GTP cyclohydrolase 1 type 2